MAYETRTWANLKGNFNSNSQRYVRYNNINMTRRLSEKNFYINIGNVFFISKALLGIKTETKG